MNTFTVWISRAGDLNELLNVDNDLLNFSGLNWDEATNLFKLSLEQGYTLIMAREEQEAGGEDAEEEKC